MSAPTVTLFGHWICPFSVRVEFALAQRGIEYTVVDVPPRAVRPKGFVVPEEFIAHSPKLEVPMVKIDGEYLADSIPILEWLEEKFSDSSLLPADDAGQAVVGSRFKPTGSAVQHGGEPGQCHAFDALAPDGFGR